MAKSQRDKFSIPDDVHYLNCAYMSPLLQTVERAGIEGIRVKAAPWQIDVGQFFEPVEETRRLAGTLVNAPAARVALVPAVSYGILIATNALTVHRGQNFVVPADEFPSIVYAFRRLSNASGAEIRLVARPVEQDSPSSTWSERVLDAIDSNTAAVALSSIHWTDGTRFDLQAIGARAREVGAAFIVDGTQSIGALPFDFEQVQADLLLCAGYKWLMGPYGLGIAVVGDRFIDSTPLEQSWIARKNSEDFANLSLYQAEYQPGARRFDVGERSNFILVPMLNAALEQVNDWGPADIQAHCQSLKRLLTDSLKDYPFVVDTAGVHAAHLFGIRNIAAAAMARIEQKLRERKVYVSIRGDALRVSPHLYNDEQDMLALAESLTQV